MCVIHKGFRVFRAVSPASFFSGNLISLKPAIPYEIIHRTSDCAKTIQVFLLMVVEKFIYENVSELKLVFAQTPFVAKQKNRPFHF
jgi:hypothetical protein